VLDFDAVNIVLGSLVLIHGLVEHWSERNISANSRHAYAFHVYDGTSVWSERNWLVISDT